MSSGPASAGSHHSDDRPAVRVRLRSILFPALLGPAQILLFGLFATYERNQHEFVLPFWTLVGPWLWVLGAIVAVLAAVGAVLRGSLAHRYVAILFALGVLLWLQGNVIPGDYGPLYGERLDLGRHAGRAPFEVGLWVSVVAAALYYSRAVASVAPLASQVLVGLQSVVLLLSTVFATAEIQPGERRWSTPPDRIYRLSRGQNIIHIVLDGFLSEVFGEIVERERAVFDRDLSGFVFFADHLGAFRSTRASMPAMLSGLAYRNEVPFQQFRERVGQRSIFRALYRQGYRINSVSFHSGDHPPRSIRHRTVRYTVPTPYGSYRSYRRFAAAQLADLTLFRHVPHVLKSGVYNGDAWLAQRALARHDSAGSEARNFRASNHVAFLDEFTSRMSVGFKEPVYLFLHVAIPHPPLVVNGDCAFTGQKPLHRPVYTAQARCALTVVQRILSRLRGLGAYDRSIILLTADHGWNIERADHPLKGRVTPVGPLDGIVLGAMPLLAIKRAGASGPLETSWAPTALTDVPATILDAAGLPTDVVAGESVFDVDPQTPRPRTYAYHSWRNADWERPFFDALHVFDVNGRVLDANAWTFRESIPEPSSSPRPD